MKHQAWIAIMTAPLVFAACAADSVETSNPGVGGKADTLTNSFDCKVVQVFDGNLLEEGLGSIYDFGRDGFPEFDEDSIEVDLRTSDFSELDSGLLLGIGQFSFGLHDAEDVVEEMVDEDAEIAWRAQLAGSDTVFSVRIFATTQVGWVHHELTPEAAASCNADFVAECDETCEGDFACSRCESDADFECNRKRDLARIDCRAQVTMPNFDDL